LVCDARKCNHWPKPGAAELYRAVSVGSG